MKRLPLVLLLLTSSAGCRESNDESSRSIISGKWGSACLPVAGALPSIQVQYQFLDDHTVLRKQQYYRDASCQELAGEITHRGDFALEVRNEINIFNIDMFFDEVKASAETDEGARLWNTLKLCGIDDWAVDQEKNVLGNSADACLSFATQRIEYRDVVQVVGEKDIIFGQTLGHLTPRPATINATEASDNFSFISY